LIALSGRAFGKASVVLGRQPIAELLALCGDPGEGPPSIEALNEEADRRAVRSRSGWPIRFVVSREGQTSSAAAYEGRIWASGEVATRQHGRGACHDGFNAFCWLAFPQVRACLNALQALALGLRADAGGAFAATPTSGRGRLRDQVTLFDESGGLLVTRNRTLASAFHAGDWQTLFVRRREIWPAEANLLLTGHALHEKLLNPYKSLCARVLWIDADPGTPLEQIDQRAAWLLDRALAHVPAGAGLDGLRPLPVMGVPGWHPANVDPAFYRDPLVFRTRSA